MGFVKEFKEFAIKGNVVDLAVGVIIGAAFGKIIDSIVKDLVMPLVSLITGGGKDFSGKFIVLKGEVPEGATLEQARAVKDANIFAYGNFITVAFNFFLLALVVFLLVKGINALKRKEENKVAAAAPPAPSKEQVLLAEIRDLLKNK